MLSKLLLFLSILFTISCQSPTEQEVKIIEVERERGDSLTVSHFIGTQYISVTDTFGTPVAFWEPQTEHHRHMHMDSATLVDSTTRFLDYGTYNVVHEFIFYGDRRKMYDTIQYIHERRGVMVLDTLNEAVKDWYERYPR